MFPIVLAPNTVVGLAGDGEGVERRRATLRDAGIAPVIVALDSQAADLEGFSLLLIAGAEAKAAAGLAERAQAVGVLVNVEDAPELCDFHLPAVVRRGDLMLTVSTGGRAPGLARRLREWLEARFGREWNGRLDELGEARTVWRAEGVPAGEISERTRQIIDGKGWLP